MYVHNKRQYAVSRNILIFGVLVVAHVQYNFMFLKILSRFWCLLFLLDQPFFGNRVDSHHYSIRNNHTKSTHNSIAVLYGSRTLLAKDPRKNRPYVIGNGNDFED